MDDSMLEVLDLTSLKFTNIEQAARQFSKATRECGFLYVRYAAEYNEVVDNLRRIQRHFFSLEEAQKNSIAIDHNNRGYLRQGAALMAGAARCDQKEVFFWGRELPADDPDLLAGVALCGPNQWPSELPLLRKAVLDYSQFVAVIGERVLEIIAAALGRERDFFKPYFERSMLRGQLLHYPPTDVHPDQFGVAPHSDFGCITLLSQETAGLEVLFPDGSWVAAPPRENTLVVNIGDLLERWSNGRLPSTRHRVRNTSAAARFSIAMFYDPSPLACVDPQQLLPDEKPAFEPIGAAEYILSRNLKAFAHYKNKQTNTL